MKKRFFKDETNSIKGKWRVAIGKGKKKMEFSSPDRSEKIKAKSKSDCLSNSNFYLLPSAFYKYFR